MGIAEDILRHGDFEKSSNALTQLGFSPEPVWRRHLLVNQTKEAAQHWPSYLTFSQGMPDYAFPPFNSWVRFNFNSSQYFSNSHSGLQQAWVGTRRWTTRDCQTTLMSDDSSIHPPLSSEELFFQCGELPRCRLKWLSGEACFEVLDEDIGQGIPGYKARARKLGYRTVAGPSGTTQNILQYATYFGMDGDWLPVLRLTMMAWMLVTLDHSFFEIMLGAEPYMPPEFSLQQGLGDLEAICPPETTLNLPGSSITGSSASQFRCSAVWRHLDASLPGGVSSWSTAQRATWMDMVKRSESQDALDYGSKCENHFACHLAGATGSCCPAVNGTVLKCCVRPSVLYM